MSFDIAESGLPPQIRIGPFPYNVVFEDLGDSFGEYRWNSAQLVFEHNQPSKEFAADTVLHEIIHGLWKTGGLAIKQKLDEEKIITVLTTGLLQVLRDNPLLVAWLVRQVET